MAGAACGKMLYMASLHEQEAPGRGPTAAESGRHVGYVSSGRGEELECSPAGAGRSEEARLVFSLLSDHCRGLTLGQLRARTGLSADTLHMALDELRRDGLVVRLNTLLESYVCRFPGIRVDDS